MLGASYDLSLFALNHESGLPHSIIKLSYLERIFNISMKIYSDWIEIVMPFFSQYQRLVQGAGECSSG